MKAITCCLAICAGILLATNATAQPSVVYFGRVTGSDHLSGVPGDWSVTIVLQRKDDGQRICATPSQGDLFACTAPVNAVVKIAAQADGYQAQIADLPSAKEQSRVRPDLVLERIETRALMRSKDPKAFENQLKVEADVAALTGRTDVFEVNFERYKQAAQGRAELLEATRRFETSASYQDVVKDPAAPRVPKGALRHLTGLPGVPVTPAEQLALLEVVQSEQLSPTIRSSAIRVLSGANDLSVDVQSTYLNALRKWSRSPESELFGVATGALNKRGTVGDQQDVVRIIQGGSSSTAIKAIESFEGTLPSTTARAVADVVTKTQDADVKVTSLRALKGSSDPETMKVVAEQTAPAESAAVRMQAVTVLGATPLTPQTTSALTKVAKTDVSAEVRAAAAAALVVKKQ